MSVKKQSLPCMFAIGIIILGLVMVSGCKKGLSKAEMIVAEVLQSQWDLNYANSSGNVEILIRGEGVARILLDTIEMIGDNLSAPPLKPVSAVHEGDHVRTEFKKNQVITLLSDPSAGSIHTVKVTFYMEQVDERMEVSAKVTISSDSGNGGETSELTVEIDPHEWSLNYDKSAGTVEAFIRGEGIDEIDLTSIEMKGDNPETAPLAAASASLQGDHIHARFPKNEVLDLLLNPAEGTTHTIIISFLEIDGTERLELSAEITIEEEDDDEPIDPSELELEIDPDEWSLNYDKSSGTVEAFIEGEGIDKIDLNSIEMKGDNPGAAPLAAGSVSLQGDHIHARFPKNQVLDLLLNPAEGSTHTIIISFLEIDGSERLELSAEITIEEDDDDDDPVDPSELELEISPDNWNLNYDKSSGEVKAFIRGEGIDKIDLDSIEMKGDNPGAASLAADSASRQGNHIQARFPKNQLLDLLLNPAKGTTHTIIVSFLEINGTVRLELSAEISINGNKGN